MLSKLLRQKPLSNELHFILIPLILIILSVKYYIFLIPLVIYLFFIIKKTKLISVISIFSLLLIIILGTKEIIKITTKSDTYKGYIVEIDSTTNSYVLKSGLIKVKCYDYTNTYNIGDIVIIEGTINENEKNYDTDFSYSEYLYSIGITYLFNVTKSEKKSHIFLISSIKDNYLNYLSNNLSTNTYQYVSKLVFGKNNIDSNLKDSYSLLGISHVLAISGLHIMILYSIISFIMLKLFKSYKPKIPLVIITIYIVLIGYPISALRAYLFILLKELNKKGNIKYTKLDILSISMILMLYLNPYSLFNSGFILTYLVSFILIYSNEIIKTKNKIKKSYLSYIFISIVTFPFVINITNGISLISFLVSPILTYLISYIVIPISYLLSVFPILDYIFKYVFISLNYIVNIISEFTYVIKVPSFNIYIGLIYFVLIIFLIYTLIKEKRRLISILTILIFLVAITSIKYFRSYSKITFLSCGQGDSSVIELAHEKSVIVIDAYNSYNFLKSKGIDNISILVLTHSDQDHIGDYKKILEHFNVDKIFYSKYDSKEEELLKDYNNKYAISDLSKVSLDGIRIECLGPIKKRDDTNSCSIVLKIKINNTSILYSADASVEEEKDIIEKYKDEVESDILKVGHHGSNTSSSSLYLDYVKPKVSIVSVAKNNRYNLPNIDVIERLNKISKVYLTYNTGNITLKIYKNNYSIYTYR